jgi:hypothetical protein
MLKHAKAVLVLLLMIAFICDSQISTHSQALHLSNHSIQVSTAQIGAVANHNFQFTYPSTSVVGSVVFQYCDDGALLTMPCSAPAGMDASAASLASQTGNTGFVIDGANSTGNKIVLTRSPIAGISALSTYNFLNITNPNIANATTYVRISTYASIDGTGAENDNGAVAFAAVNPFQIGADVPPFIKLCVGITVSNDCSVISGDSLNLGVLSSSSTKSGISQFAAGTNSVTGYNLYTLGTTMTSGNNIIPAINPSGTSKVGTSQFGINLKANSVPPVGQDPQGAGTGVPQAGYGSPNNFKFQNGDSIATSSLSSDYNKMTVSYIVNINSSQAPGVYSTTITYLGIADF